jgi:hypothetical protein
MLALNEEAARQLVILFHVARHDFRCEVMLSRDLPCLYYRWLGLKGSHQFVGGVRTFPFEANQDDHGQCPPERARSNDGDFPYNLPCIPQMTNPSITCRSRQPDRLGQDRHWETRIDLEALQDPLIDGIEFQTGAHGHPFDDKFYQ